MERWSRGERGVVIGVCEIPRERFAVAGGQSRETRGTITRRYPRRRPSPSPSVRFAPSLESNR